MGELKSAGLRTFCHGNRIGGEGGKGTRFAPLDKVKDVDERTRCTNVSLR